MSFGKWSTRKKIIDFFCEKRAKKNLSKPVKPATLLMMKAIMNYNPEVIDTIKEFGNGSRFLSMITLTEPKMLKKNRKTKEPNPYEGRIVKLTKYVFHINADYKKVVEKQIKKTTGEEVDYPVKENYFRHTDICKSIVTDRKSETKLYICGILRNTKSKWFLKTETGKLVMIDKKQLKDYLPEKKKSEFKPEFRTIELKNVLRIQSGKIVWDFLKPKKISKTRNRDLVVR
jgi:hypothetical protein